MKNLLKDNVVYIKLSELKQLRVLGKGQFIVNEMEHEPSGYRFAVKASFKFYLHAISFFLIYLNKCVFLFLRELKSMN